MIRIIRSRTLAGLAEAAAKVPELRRQADERRREADEYRAQAERLQGGIDYWTRQEKAARAAAGRAAARLDALTEETGRRLGSLIKAARDPPPGARRRTDMTDADRDMISRARRLASLDTTVALRSEYGVDSDTTGTMFALTLFWGAAVPLLGRLADRLERDGADSGEEGRADG